MSSCFDGRRWRIRPSGSLQRSAAKKQIPPSSSQGLTGCLMSACLASNVMSGNY